MSFLRDIEREALPDKGCKSYVYDDEVRGLAVRFTHTGHRSYVVRFLNSRTRKHEYLKLGDFTAFDIRKARELARIQLGNLQTTVAVGRDPKQERRRSTAQQITLQQALDKYLHDKSNKKMQKHLSEAAQRDYRSCIQCHLKSYLNKPMMDLTKDDFLRVYLQLGKVKPRTAVKLGRYTRAVLNYVNRENDGTLFAKNPVSLALSGRLFENARKQTFVQFERLKDFFKVLEALDVDDQDFIKVAMFSGMRSGAIRTLKWENIDLQNGIMHVYEAAIYKGTSPLPIADYLIGILEIRRARRLSSEWVFPGRDGGPLAEHKKIFKRLAFPSKEPAPLNSNQEAAARSDQVITAHDLRRTFATVAASIGLSESIIGDLLLHKRGESVTAGYIIPQVRFLKTCVDQIALEICRLGFGALPHASVQQREENSVRKEE